MNDCIFCDKKQYIKLYKSVYAKLDNYPVTKGHTLIIPFRHVETYFNMIKQEKEDADKLINIIKNELIKNDSTIEGFNIGINCGEVAGQTINHAHIHLIPRRRGDVQNPRGGIRNIVPNIIKY